MHKRDRVIMNLIDIFFMNPIKEAKISQPWRVIAVQDIRFVPMKSQMNKIGTVRAERCNIYVSGFCQVDTDKGGSMIN